MAKGFDVGDLLNNTSKANIPNNQYTIEYVDLDKLETSENNFYNTDDIENLKESIELIGLSQPIEVWDDGERFVIISGHRRYKAFCELYEKGYEEYRAIPCIFKDELNETEAEIHLIFGNSATRELSDHEKSIQVSKLEELLEKWQKEGKKIEGRKRDIIANQLKISKTQVGRYQSINKNLSEELKEELKNNNINLTTASELSRLDENKQKEQLEKIKQGEKVTAKSIVEEIKSNEVEKDDSNKDVGNWTFKEQTTLLEENQSEVEEETAELSVDATKKEETKNVPIMDTKSERVFVLDKSKRDAIENYVRKYTGKLNVVSTNISKYQQLNREPNKNDLDEQLEYQIIVEALMLLREQVSKE